MKTKKCEICGNLFSKPYFLSKKGWKIRRFCTAKCKYIWWGKNLSGWGKGMKRDGSWQLGANNPSWKGKKVSYHGLHSWVNRNFIRPKSCEFCKKSDNGKRRLTWACKSHKLYTRNRNDWIYLCVSCHLKYDLQYNNRKDNFHKIRLSSYL